MEIRPCQTMRGTISRLLAHVGSWPVAGHFAPGYNCFPGTYRANMASDLGPPLDAGRAA
jgi:hypothetical protein